MNDKPHILCIYYKDCKYCQIINEYLDYLASSNKIKYARVNVYKIANSIKSMLLNNNNINVRIPYVYIVEGDKFISLDISELLLDSMKYKKTLKNTEKSKSILDSLMLARK